MRSLFFVKGKYACGGKSFAKQGAEIKDINVLDDSRMYGKFVVAENGTYA